MAKYDFQSMDLSNIDAFLTRTQSHGPRAGSIGDIVADMCDNAPVGASFTFEKKASTVKQQAKRVMHARLDAGLSFTILVWSKDAEICVAAKVDQATFDKHKARVYRDRERTNLRAA